MILKRLKKKRTILTNPALVIVTTVLLACVVAAVLFFNRSPKSSQEASPIESQDIQVVEPQNKALEENKEESSGTVITTGDSEFGAMLFNDAGQAIYIWELEESAEAECYGDCAVLWPPVLTDSAPRASGSVRSELLGTTKRTDGSVQVTYNGHPLYYYAHEGPGEVECHNIRTHGGLWWVIQPNGIRAD